MARSSTRSIRNRQSGDAAQLREMKAKAAALSSSSSQAEFRKGFDYVCKDVAAGMPASHSFDLASTPADARGRAFMAGANAALDMFDGDGSYAKKLAQAYGVDLG